MLSFMAKTTTVIAFGTAIYALIFPEQAGAYLARLTQHMEAASQQLESISRDGAVTAQATTQLAESVASRPRFEVQVFGTPSRGTPLIQMRFENVTSRPIREMATVLYDENGAKYSNFDVYLIPPFETVMDQSDKPITAICFSYVLDGDSPVRLTEHRAFSVNQLPTLDKSGNAATFDVKQVQYDVTQEATLDIFMCREEPFSPDVFRETKLERAQR